MFIEEEEEFSPKKEDMTIIVSKQLGGGRKIDK